jgi:quercetin dioxygenase-like cupin family protein
LGKPGWFLRGLSAKTFFYQGMTMPVPVFPVNRPEWTPLAYAGCHNVDSKGLLRLDHLSLAMLRFAPHGTIHEHPAGFDIDVICLEGEGFTSVGGEVAPLHAGERVHWPAGAPHRLWTEESTMITLMVEQVQRNE